MYIFVIRKSDDVLFHDILFPQKILCSKTRYNTNSCTCMYIHVLEYKRQKVINEVILIEKNY